MSTYDDLSLDIETLDTEPSAVILQIGVCVFDALTMTRPVNTLCLQVRAHQPNRTVNAKTLLWWMEQDQRAIDDVVVGAVTSTVTLKEQLAKLSTYIATYLTPKTGAIWCKGSGFDAAILAHAFAQHGMAVPWEHYQVENMRTLLHASKRLEFDIKKRVSANTAPHDALSDAIHQAKQIQTFFNTYRPKRQGWWR